MHQNRFHRHIGMKLLAVRKYYMHTNINVYSIKMKLWVESYLVDILDIPIGRTGLKFSVHKNSTFVLNVLHRPSGPEA